MSIIRQQKVGGRFLSLPDLQSYLGVRSRKTLLKYIKSGQLQAYKLGGTRWRIAQADVEHFLKSQRLHKKTKWNGSETMVHG